MGVDFQFCKKEGVLEAQRCEWTQCASELYPKVAQTASAVT